MTLEVWSTLASVGTFVVIAATAIAALIQLRHMRGSNQIAVLMDIVERYSAAEYLAARRTMDEIIDRLDDVEVRAAMMQTPWPAEFRTISTVGNLFETLGSLVKHRIVDPEIAIDMWGGVAIALWTRMLPAIAILRRVRTSAVFENFEYLVVLTEDYVERHRDTSTYPRGVRRLPVPDPWLDKDKSAGIVPPTLLEELQQGRPFK